MKTILAAFSFLLVLGCGPSNLELIKQSYSKGEINDTQFATLYNAEIDRQNQRRENAAIIGAALLGYSAQMQANQEAAQANADTYYYYQKQNFYQRQQLQNQQMQNLYLQNLYMQSLQHR